MDDDVLVCIEGRSVRIARATWDVLYRAINVLVDTGDIIAHLPELTSGQLALAKMASGSLYLIANPPHRPSEQPAAQP